MPAVVQDAASGAVLMLAHMNEEAWERTLGTGQAWFWSRSRRELWEKGATSGNRMTIVEVRLDCDDDAVLLRVDPAGPPVTPVSGRASSPWWSAMPVSDAQDDLALALDLAGLADEITMGRFRAADLRVDTKPDDTPVTDADRMVELLVRDAHRHGPAGPRRAR